MVFEAAVVIIVCLIQSPDFRDRVISPFRRGRPPTAPTIASQPLPVEPRVEVAP